MAAALAIEMAITIASVTPPRKARSPGRKLRQPQAHALLTLGGSIGLGRASAWRPVAAKLLTIESTKTISAATIACMTVASAENVPATSRRLARSCVARATNSEHKIAHALRVAADFDRAVKNARHVVDQAAAGFDTELTPANVRLDARQQAGAEALDVVLAAPETN